MKGYMGKMAMVDIGKKMVESRRIPEEWFRDYIGGEGVAVRLFYELVDPKWDTFDEKQPLIFATGPLTGTAAPTSGRWCVVYRSPLSKTLGASNCGGYFAPALKKAGWDLLVVTGKAEKTCFPLHS
jgi:aldehyde:ferredoxin oxidoreductase